MAAESFETLAKAERIALGAGPVEATLAPTVPDLAARLAAIPPGRRLYLVLRDLRTNEPPEAIYRVHLGLPKGTPPAAGGFHNVGSLNFFNAGSEPAPSRFYSYDVADLVGALLARGALADALTVTVAPTSRPNAAAQPFIGEIALVLQ